MQSLVRGGARGRDQRRAPRRVGAAHPATKERLGLNHRGWWTCRAAARRWGGPRTSSRRWRSRASRSRSCATRAACCRCRRTSRSKLLHLVLSSDARMDGDDRAGRTGGRAGRSPRPGGDDRCSVPRCPTSACATSWPARPTSRTCWCRRSCAWARSAARPTCRSRDACLLRSLAASVRNLVVVSFGSPYLLRQFPQVPAYVCAYGWAESSQRAAMSALFGEQPVDGQAAGDAARPVSVRPWPADGAAPHDPARRPAGGGRFPRGRPGRGRRRDRAGAGREGVPRRRAGGGQGRRARPPAAVRQADLRRERRAGHAPTRSTTWPA